MSVPAPWPCMQSVGVVRYCFTVVVAARQSGGKVDGVQAPIGANTHPPGGFLLDFDTPS